MYTGEIATPEAGRATDNRPLTLTCRHCGGGIMLLDQGWTHVNDQATVTTGWLCPAPHMYLAEPVPADEAPAGAVDAGTQRPAPSDPVPDRPVPAGNLAAARAGTEPAHRAAEPADANPAPADQPADANGERHAANA